VGIRETLNKNPGITTGATAGIIVLALAFIFWQLRGGGTPTMATTAFYTTDDGATWFEDDINKLAPFDKGGKLAYRVYVYKCASGDPFVSHLERYTEQAKKAIEAARAKGGGMEDPTIYETISMSGMEVKDPKTGDKGWVKQGNVAAAAKITEPKCPDGTTNGLEPVVPG
jgi:hypothetical protein